MSLKMLTDNIWTVSAPYHVLGVSLGLRMTIIRLASGDLIAHSPIRTSKNLIASIRALGNLRYLIIPNHFHHRDFHHLSLAFPGCQLLASKPVLRRIEPRCGQISCCISLSKESIWPQLQIIPLQGMPKIQEWLFYHQPSKTLIATDLFFNIQCRQNLWSRCFWKVMGITPGAPGQTRTFRRFIYDHKAYQQSLDEIRSLQVRRTIISHGEIIPGHAIEKYLGPMP